MDYYSNLLSLISEKELNEKIKLKIKEFHGYISKEAAINLIAKEFNIYKKDLKIFKIKDILPEQKEISIKGKAVSIGKKITYLSGKSSRELVISDETGSVPVIFWEQNVELLNKIRLNDILLINNLSERFGRLNFGYKSNLIITEKSEFSDFASLNDGKTYSLIGVISKINENNKMEFSITDGKNTLLVKIQKVDAENFDIRAGDGIILENVFFKNFSIFIFPKSRILIKKNRNFISGKINLISLEGDKLVVVLDDKQIYFEDENIYSFLNVKKSQNIPLETLINIKKDFYLKKYIMIKVVDEKKEKIEKIFFKGG